MLSQILTALSATSLSSIHLIAQNDFGNKLLPVTSIKSDRLAEVSLNSPFKIFTISHSREMAPDLK